MAPLSLSLSLSLSAAYLIVARLQVALIADRSDRNDAESGRHQRAARPHDRDAERRLVDERRRGKRRESRRRRRVGARGGVGSGDGRGRDRQDGRRQVGRRRRGGERIGRGERGGGGSSGGRQTLHTRRHTLCDQRVNIVNVENGLCDIGRRRKGGQWNSGDNVR